MEVPPANTRDRKLLTVLLLLMAVLFWVANKPAYKGYFQADTLDNLVVARDIPLKSYARALLWPEFYDNNFRAVGLLFNRTAGSLFGLWFPPYVIALQIIHLVNVCLLYLLLRKMGLPLVAACAASLFFAFHMAVFSVYWEPMYVFDLLCGTFCLLSLLLYVSGRWILAFVAFWLAYRSKELAVTLPVALLACELIAGQRRWKRLIPFFALSAAMGVFALVHNAAPSNAYALRFKPADILTCAEFYASRLFLIPFAGFAILVLPALVRDRRAAFGAITLCVLLGTMLLLPGRLNSAYLYAPLIGAAIAISAAAARWPKATGAALLALWIPWNYVNLRWLRRAELARADATRTYLAAVLKLARQHPQTRTFVYNDAPLDSWGISGAIRMLHPPGTDVTVVAEANPDSARALRTVPLIMLKWTRDRPLKALVHESDNSDPAYIMLGELTPPWLLTSGWYGGGDFPFRWIQPVATATLRRPPGATRFEVTININPEMIHIVKETCIRVSLDDEEIGEREFDHSTWKTIGWPIPPGPSGAAHVRFEVTPGFRTSPDSDLLGIAIGGFGFK